MTPVLDKESTRELLKNEVERITGMIRFRYPVLSEQLADTSTLKGSNSELNEDELCNYLNYLQRELGNFRRLMVN